MHPAAFFTLNGTALAIGAAIASSEPLGFLAALAYLLAAIIALCKWIAKLRKSPTN